MESFIPLWEWDLPRKRSKKNERVDSEKKGKEPTVEGNGSGRGGPTIEEVDDSGDSRPASRARSITVEEIADDDE